MARSSDDRDPVERLAEEFLERHRRGERPAPTEYVDRYPEWAEEIRALFPALMMMEGLKPDAGDDTGTFVGDGRSRPGHVPERLGDFRILREIGRGGMGIVYEAEQESLGRHVALKVLPAHALLNPRHLQRFFREARAAARLHHTNIVPVFGVGEEGGLHYYVMQFIAGSGLHEVIEELRHIKTVGKAATESVATPGPSPSRSVREVAWGLLTGHFAAAPAEEATTEPGPPAAPAAAARSGPPIPDGDGGSAILSAAGRGFAKAVARVGLQVAEALGYAHNQGILHRDIKPSNLLLDVQGTIWVADFGLAKVLSDTDDLTDKGDVLGTLRYMAPERFRGQSDGRSDLYALGLTLYELLTLRPAFDQVDRDRLIHQVTTEVPPRPRTLNPGIPRDLETIVLKAIEHEPARRYQDAQDLADDLQRFLADRPVKARPVGALERAWKWAKRKPAVAGLLAAFALAVIAGFAGVTWQWREAVAARDDARANANRAELNFEHALETVNTFCTQVSEEQLLDEPGMQPLRRRLLELARQYYQRFQREQGDDPNVKRSPELTRELAQTFLRYGILTGELGDPAAAQLALLRAKDILTELTRKDPGNAALRVQLARCYIALEEADRLHGYSVSEGSYDLQREDAWNCVKLMEPLVATEPENREYLGVLGRGYNVLGIRYLNYLQDPAAKAAFLKAIAALGRGHTLAPEDPELAGWLALAHADLGLVEQRTGRHADGARAFGQALDVARALEDRFPRSRRYRLGHARCLVQLGVARIELGRYVEAEVALNEAHQRLAALSGQDAGWIEARYWWHAANQGLGRVALARGRTFEARRRLREAVAILERAPAPSLIGRDHLALGWSYVWLGWTEVAAGRNGEIGPLAAKLGKIRGAIQQGLTTAVTVALISREIALIEDQIGLLRAAGAGALPGRIASQEASVRAWQGRAGKYPENLADRFELAWSRVLLAELLVEAGRAPEVRPHLGTASRALQELTGAEPENLRWRQGLARAWEALARVQAGSEARATAEKAVVLARELAEADPAYAYDLACALALRGRLSASKADEELAVAALRRAIRDGFEDSHRFRTDPRLDGLRSRPDFPVATPTGG